MRDDRTGEFQHSDDCPPNPHGDRSPTITLTRREDRGGASWKPGLIVREYWAPHANPDWIVFPGVATASSEQPMDGWAGLGSVSPISGGPKPETVKTSVITRNG